MRYVQDMSTTSRSGSHKMPPTTSILRTISTLMSPLRLGMRGCSMSQQVLLTTSVSNLVRELQQLWQLCLGRFWGDASVFVLGARGHFHCHIVWGLCKWGSPHGCSCILATWSDKGKSPSRCQNWLLCVGFTAVACCRWKSSQTMSFI